MHVAAKRQKLLSAGTDVIAPKKKASAPVRDVIVIEGPACIKPILHRSSADRCYGV